MTYLQNAVHGGVHKIEGFDCDKMEGSNCDKTGSTKRSKNCSDSNHSTRQLKLSAQYKVMLKLPATSECSYAGSLIHLPMVSFVPTATTSLVH